MLASTLRFLENNTPSAKPELWSDLPFSLLRNLKSRYSSPSGSRIVTLRCGSRMSADTSTSIGQALYLYRCWEYPVTRLLELLLTPETVFFDVGANVGYYSIVAASICQKVYAFEPVPSLMAEFQRNIALNGFSPKIEACARAVSNHNGDDSFYVVEGENTGLSSLHESSGGQRITVQTTSLDSFVEIQKISRVDLMKVDVEGAEPEVFEGAANLLKKESAPDIIFECHPGASSDRILESFGYRVYELRRQRDYEARNLFASKRRLPSAVLVELRLRGM